MVYVTTVTALRSSYVDHGCVVGVSNTLVHYGCAKNIDFRKSLGLIFICVKNVIRSKKTLLKPFLTTRSPWSSARTAIMGNIMENGCVEKNIFKKALKDGISANLRQLYNSNMPKVSIVKRSQNNIFVARSVLSGILNFLENFRFYCNF